MSEALLRQRRNLFVLCIVLLMLSLGNVDIKSVSLLGVEFNFKKNITFLYSTIWILWGYFLYRYAVYLNQEGKQNFGRIYMQTFEDVISPYIKIYVNSLYEEPNDACGYSYTTVKANKYLYFGQAFDSSFDHNTGKRKKEVRDIRVDFNIKPMIFWKIKALCIFLFFRSAITDYILPILFSMLVFVIALSSSWAGNPF